MEEYQRPCGQDRLRRRRQPHQGGHRLRPRQGPRRPRTSSAARSTAPSTCSPTQEHARQRPWPTCCPMCWRACITAIKLARAPAAGPHIAEYFVRPVRWIVAMLDDVVLPVSFAGAESGLTSRMGHRVLAPGKHDRRRPPPNLLDVIARRLRDPQRRQSASASSARAWRPSRPKPASRADLPAKTLLEVVNLSEYPQPLVVRFRRGVPAACPRRSSCDAMLMHQRYFPLYDADGQADEQVHHRLQRRPRMRRHHHRRQRARGARPSRTTRSSSTRRTSSIRWRPTSRSLDKVVFQESLGTVRREDRAPREAGLRPCRRRRSSTPPTQPMRSVPRACARLTWSPTPSSSSPASAGRHGQLLRRRLRARTPQVAQAIAQHYQPALRRRRAARRPRWASWWPWPTSSTPSAACSPSARRPTGSSDPFALRRSAIGIVNMLRGGPAHVAWAAAIDASLAQLRRAGHRRSTAAAVRAEVVRLLRHRARKVMLRDAGVSARHHRRRAGRGRGGAGRVHQPARPCARGRPRQRRARRSTTWPRAYARANNLRDARAGRRTWTRPCSGPSLSARSLGAVATAEAGRGRRACIRRLRLAALSPGWPPCARPSTRFFADVMVMDEDAALRENRLRLLNRFVAVFANVADFGQDGEVKVVPVTVFNR